jgi:glycosyltransferase involved in cell wall biosynthesis
MAKISIIIPTYNVEEYLEECLESVVNQTLQDIEIICVNDGSVDGSLQILQKYAKQDHRIILIDKENEGYGKAMNIGLDRATGEYIGIVEPDDFVPVYMYGELYQKAVGHDLDFVKADFYRFSRDAKGNMELFYNHLSRNPKDYNHVFCPEECPETLRFIMNTWSGIYRRSFLNEYHIRHNETPGASFQDNGFWFQTFFYGKRAMIMDRPYYMNRRDNPNSSVKSTEKVYCVNAEYDFIRDILMRSPEKWERFKGMYWLKKYHNYNGTLWRIAGEYREEYLLRFSAEFRRGMERHELERERFSALEWERIQQIVNTPHGYYETFVRPVTEDEAVRETIRALEARNMKLSAEIRQVRSSWTFRAGKALMYIPRRIRKKMLRNRNGK